MTHPTKPRRRTLITVTAAVLLSGLMLTSCADSAPESASSSSSNQVSDSEFLAVHDLGGLDAAQVIERLDTMPVADRPTDLLASVQPDALVLTDDQERETQLPMPEDKVYVSVAPYREQTHDCYFHSLTTCIGELGNADVQVMLTDADGKVLVNETRETFDNGFVGLWVPRGVEATLTIEHEGQTGTATVTTLNEDDPTCITTLRLT
ncbi:CueP family metal-binding protein [Nesterenkonia sp. HG001]|uniref:CueP family metal-binding protein n=1 Tax=Nesterenkonia sp. HG001 TaxID=2983207 RepID=UPI002AC3CEF1|nr:CueP family metal-binding protein [Nesterenkonia sp. HG001]MDZ5078864.1 CueP family metal-binding protein [Nesterenkonia sp. HG001]